MEQTAHVNAECFELEIRVLFLQRSFYEGHVVAGCQTIAVVVCLYTHTHRQTHKNCACAFVSDSE